MDEDTVTNDIVNIYILLYAVSYIAMVLFVYNYIYKE